MTNHATNAVPDVAKTRRLAGRPIHYAILLGVSGLLFFTNLGGATLWDLDEGRNATAALEMMTSQNYIVPTYNGELRDHKPVLQYWLQTLSFHWFGVNEFGARMPSALAAMLSVLLCYELARGMFGKTTGLLAGLIVAATPMLIAAARFTNPDAMLNAAFLFTMWAFWKGQERQTPFWYGLVGAGFGLGLLAKGPVGLALPSLIIFSFLLWERRLGALWHRYAFWTWLAAFAVAAPWYIWVIAETKGRFITGFVLVHNVDRFIRPMENHGGNPLYYLIVMFIGMAPWSLFVVLALWLGMWSAVRRPWPRFQRVWEWARDDRARGDDAAYRLLILWAILYLTCFSIAATKLPLYVLPAIAPCAILIARFLERWRLGLFEMPRWYMPQAVIFLALGGLSAFAALAIIAGKVYDFAFLRGRSFPELFPFAWLALMLPMTAIIVWRFYRLGRRTVLVGAATVLFTTFLLPLAVWASAALNAYKPPAAVAEILRHLRPEMEYQLVGFEVKHLPSLNFYLRRDITHIHSFEQLQEHLAYPMPVYVLILDNYWNEFHKSHPTKGRELGRCPDLYRNRAIVVVTNQN
jgi:4-amino-4-deoxy-L-arabinose transferase-like glycosyltransferase